MEMVHIFVVYFGLVSVMLKLEYKAGLFIEIWKLKKVIRENIIPILSNKG